MKKIKHPTEILTEAEAIVISSSIIFALSIIIFCFKHFFVVLFFALSIAMFAFSYSINQYLVGWLVFNISLRCLTLDNSSFIFCFSSRGTTSFSLKQYSKLSLSLV